MPVLPVIDIRRADFAPESLCHNWCAVARLMNDWIGCCVRMPPLPHFSPHGQTTALGHQLSIPSMTLGLCRWHTAEQFNATGRSGPPAGCFENACRKCLIVFLHFPLFFRTMPLILHFMSEIMPQDNCTWVLLLKI